MEKSNIDGVVLENWQENTLELARRNGLPESSIVISPSKTGKTEMLQMAQELSVARKRDSELKQHLKSSKAVNDSMNEVAGELYGMPNSKPSDKA